MEITNCPGVEPGVSAVGAVRHRRELRSGLELPRCCLPELLWGRAARDPEGIVKMTNM